MKKYNLFSTLNQLIQLISFRSALSFLVNTILKSMTIILFPIFVEKIMGLVFTENSLVQIIKITVSYFLLMMIIEIIALQNNKRNYTAFNDIRRKFTAQVHMTMMKMEYSKFDHAQELDQAYAAFEGTSSNDDGIEGIYHTLYELGWKIVSFFLLSIYLSIINRYIAASFIVLSLLIFYLSWQEEKIDRNHMEQLYHSKRKLVYFTFDTSDISYGKEKRIYQFSQNIKQRYEQSLHEYSADLNQTEHEKKKYYLFSECIHVFKYILIFILFAISYKNGTAIDQIIAALTVVFAYSSYLDEIIKDCSKIIQESEKANHTLSFIHSLSDEKKQTQSITDIHEIEFRNVTFQYDKNSEPVIQNCSFTIKKGETAALLGLNGAGKTTLTKLLLGLYQPTEGMILINGINIADFNHENYLNLISYAEQETNLISLRICDFISGDISGYDKNQVEKVLEQVGLLTKIMQLPKGIESAMTKYLDADGIEFSGGEIQKLYIARAMYKQNTSLYIFDEPTSALDYKNEKDIYDAFYQVSQGKMAIYISHKLHTTDFCSRLMILKDGMICEDGTQEQLYQNKQHYYEMVNAQKESEA